MFDEKRITATHEAGHAVAFQRLWEDSGRLGGRLSIEPDTAAGTLGGHGSEELTFPAGKPTDEAERKQWYYEALTLCAGYAALRAAGYGEDVAIGGADSDFEDALAICENYLSTSLDAIKADAVTLMQRPENIRAVRYLADTLLQWRTIPADDVDVLIEVADGFITEAELQRYLMVKYPDREQSPPR